MLTQTPKSTPAYSGARFDKNGFCLAHQDVRLCSITSNGQYKIVRKICFKCGGAALVANPSNQNMNVHGYQKKTLPHRGRQSDLLTAGDGSGRDRRRNSKIIEHDSPQNPSRERTLSPRRSKNIRKSRSKLVPASTSQLPKKLSDENIKELQNIKPPPPLFTKSSSKSSIHHSNSAKQGIKKGRHQESKTSEGVGRRGSEGQLARGRSIKGDGNWESAKKEASNMQKRSSKTNLYPKLNKSTAIHTIPPLTPPTLPTSTPQNSKNAIRGDSFSRALVICNEGDIISNDTAEETKHNGSPVAKKVDKNRMIMPNSTTRMATTARKKHREHSKRHIFAA